MIELQKSVIEAEALAKLRKEQYFRELLAGELGVMIEAHFASKEPLREVIPQFVIALKDLVVTAREIFDYIEGVKAAEPKAPFEEWAETDYPEAAKYIKASQAITVELNKNNKKTLDEMVEAQAAEEVPSTAADSNKRIFTKDIITDEELDRRYFKEGLTIQAIASMYKVGASGLYKRIEQMKADRKKIEKECARQ